MVTVYTTQFTINIVRIIPHIFMDSHGTYEYMSSLFNTESFVDSQVVVILLYTHSAKEALFGSTYSLTDSIPILAHHSALLNIGFQCQSHCQVPLQSENLCAARDRKGLGRLVVEVSRPRTITHTNTHSTGLL